MGTSRGSTTARRTRLLLQVALLAVPPCAADFGKGPRTALAMDLAARRDAVPAATTAKAPPAPRAIARLQRPVTLEQNRGQGPEGPAFLARAAHWTAALDADGATFSSGAGGIEMRFDGARSEAGVEVTGFRPGFSHHLGVGYPDGGITHVPHVASLRVADAWPGVTLDWLRHPECLEFTLTLAPTGAGRADPPGIAFPGARWIRVLGNGDLRVRRGGRELLLSAPVAWQVVGDVRRSVDARWQRRRGARARIVLGDHDPSLPVVVDPRVRFSTYRGLTGSYRNALGVGVLSTGAVVLGSDFSSVQGSINSVEVAKYTEDGQDLDFATIIGESLGGIYLHAMAIDKDDGIHIAGRAGLETFVPVAAPQPNIHGESDGWILGLNDDASAFRYATFLGGSEWDMVTAMTVTEDGVVVVCGSTQSDDFPSVASLDSTLGGTQDGFVAAMPIEGGEFLFTTLIGGSVKDEAYDVAVDSAGRIVVVGNTDSGDYPGVPEGTVIAPSTGGDASVAMLAADGSSLVFGRLFGGAGSDDGNSVVVTADDDIWIAGTTTSVGLATEGSFESERPGGQDIFVARLSGASGETEYCSYYGGTMDDFTYAAALDHSGHLWVGGRTESSDFPTHSGSFSATYPGNTSGFLFKVDTAALLPSFSTYFGGSGSILEAVAPGRYGLAVCGRTRSTALQTVFPLQPSRLGTQDAFVASIPLGPSSPLNVFASVYNHIDCTIGWADGSVLGDEYLVQRKEFGEEWTTIGTTLSPDRQFADEGLERSTTYYYRIISINAEGDSPPSGEVMVTTDPPAPGTPVDAAVTPTTATSALLSWTAVDATHTGFEVHRGPLGSALAKVMEPEPEATQATDEGLSPGRAYRWFVQSVNKGGPSGPSSLLEAVMPPSLDLVLAKGSYAHSAKSGTATLKASGTFAFTEWADDALLPIRGMGMEVRLGGASGTAILTIPAADPNWKVRGTKLTWKSARGALPKASVTVDTGKQRFAVSVAKADLPGMDPDSVSLWIATAGDGGGHEGAWSAKKKAGVYKYP